MTNTGLNLVKVFTGSELTVNLLREELENIGVTSIIKDEFSSGIAAGFVITSYSIHYTKLYEFDFIRK